MYAAYEKGGKQMTEFHLRSTHSNDLTVTYTDADGKRTGVSILCEDDKGSYRVTFDQGLNTQSPYVCRPLYHLDLAGGGQCHL